MSRGGQRGRNGRKKFFKLELCDPCLTESQDGDGGGGDVGEEGGWHLGEVCVAMDGENG